MHVHIHIHYIILYLFFKDKNIDTEIKFSQIQNKMNQPTDLELLFLIGTKYTRRMK